MMLWEDVADFGDAPDIADVLMMMLLMLPMLLMLLMLPMLRCCDVAMLRCCDVAMLLISMSQDSVCDAKIELIDVVIPVIQERDEFQADN